MKTSALKIWGLMIILGLLTAGAAFSQAGHGKARLVGVVVDSQGKPVENAKIAIVFSPNKNLVLEATTNKKGEWAFLGLGTGRWIMTVTAPGYVPYRKDDLDIKQLDVNPKITVKVEKAKSSLAFIQDEESLKLLDQGNQLFKEGRYDTALVLYQQFMEKNPAAYQINLNIAECHREKGEFDKAADMYNKVIELAKTDVPQGKEMTAKALAGIGNCYLKQNKLQEARDFFQKSIENSPKDEVLAYNVGEIYFSNQNIDEALKYFNIASEIKPDWPDPYLKLGYVYLNKGDNAAAVAKLEKFLTLEPDGERAAQVKNILNLTKKQMSQLWRGI